MIFYIIDNNHFFEAGNKHLDTFYPNCRAVHNILLQDFYP